MEHLTARKKLRLYWTSDPTYLGYADDGKRHDWNPTGRKPNLTGTPKTIVEKWHREKKQSGLNSGVYYSVAIYDCNGNQYSLSEINEFLAMTLERKRHGKCA